jgi:hypothetical protein
MAKSINQTKILKSIYIMILCLFKINPGVIGFYRVKYSPEMFTVLVHAIRDKKMEPIDRQNILDDQFALFLGGIGTTIDVRFHFIF